MIAHADFCGGLLMRDTAEVAVVSRLLRVLDPHRGTGNEQLRTGRQSGVERDQLGSLPPRPKNRQLCRWSGVPRTNERAAPSRLTVMNSMVRLGRPLLAGVLVAGAVAGCASRGSTPMRGGLTSGSARLVTSLPPAYSSSPPESVVPPGTIGVSDNHAVLILHVGQARQILLASPEPFRWDQARLSNSTVAALTNATGGYPSARPFSAVVTARKVGETQLTSTTDIFCFHTRPVCLPPVELWAITIKVVT